MHKIPVLLLLLLIGCRQHEITVEKPQDVQAPTAPAPLPQQHDDTITILAWNVESGGSDPNVIAEQLKTFGDIDIYCLSEVSPKEFTRYREAIGSNFASFDSRTGGADRLQVIYNNERFEMLEERELDRHRDYALNNGNHRSPIYVRLRDRESELEFVVMTNHLARGNEDIRNQQAIGLREWARDQAQSVGLICIGDHNMDFDFRSQRGNDAFVEMLRDNIWKWVKPDPLIDTNWDDRDGDGKDNYPDSMLDFAFVAGLATEWSPTCRVIVRDGDFPDDKTTSDHRPIELKLTVPAAP